KSIRDRARTINKLSAAGTVRKHKSKLNKLGSDRLYATIGYKKGWQIDDCFFVENRLNEIGSQIYGFYCPNRLSATLDGFFCTEQGQNANLNLNSGNSGCRVRKKVPANSQESI
ncbi:MAG: hypothetical protein OSA44_10075, partial [Nitrospinaceae bacterium]|nr:hypothetical protein [Nitrospinaceae bacterium]